MQRYWLRWRLPVPLSSYGKSGLILVVFALLGAGFLYLERFTTIPPGTHNDIAQLVADGLRISRTGSFPLYLDTRPEPLQRFLLAAAVRWDGNAPYTERLMGILVGLLTVAAIYRAALELLRLLPWTTPATQVLGALLAATVMMSNVTLRFLDRQGYNAGLLPLSIALMLFAFARAWRLRRPGAYVWTGFWAGFPVNTYIAGLVAPLAGLGAIFYMAILGRRDQRPRGRAIMIMLATTALAASPQIYLFLRVPDLYGRIRAAQVYTFGTGNPDWQPFITSFSDLLGRLDYSFRAFYQIGYYSPDLNIPDVPFLNPFFTLLAAVGVLVALLTWRRLPGPLCVGLLLAMTMPGALSQGPNHPARLAGTFAPLAALASLGTGGLLALASGLPSRISTVRLRPVLRFAVLMLLVIGLVASPVVARQQFNAHWQNPKFWQDPEYWLSFPHYFGINFHDFLTMLKQVKGPTYVTMPQIDSATAAWYLGAMAYPNIRALDSLDPLIGPQGLPAGELWYPYAGEFNVKILAPAEQFALLLPGPDGRDGTILILPPLAEGKSTGLRERAEREGAPIINGYGWRLGWRLPIRPDELTAPVRREDWHPVGARFGSSLELVGYEAPLTLAPGETTRVTFYWRALARVPYDVFGFCVLLDGDNRVEAQSEDLWLYHWIYPSVFWKPGEVIPDVRFLTLKPDAPQESYRLNTGLYTPPGYLPRLPVFSPNGQRVPDDWLLLQNHRVPISPVELPGEAIRVDARFGDTFTLEAYTSDKRLDSLRPGESVTLRLYWRATGRMNQSYTLFVHATDSQGKIVVQQDVQPLGGRYPTNVWEIGERVAVDYNLTIPAQTPPGEYAFRVGAYSFPTLDRLPVTQGGRTPDDRRAQLP